MSDHACYWPGCDVRIPLKLFACRPHWFALPKRLRDRIWRAYRPGQEVTKDPSPAYLDAAWEARAWATAHADSLRAGEGAEDGHDDEDA